MPKCVTLPTNGVSTKTGYGFLCNKRLNLNSSKLYFVLADIIF